MSTTLTAADAGNQLSLDVFDRPADWPEGKNSETLTIYASCTPADIIYRTDLKLVNEARKSSERISGILHNLRSELRKNRTRYVRGKAYDNFLSYPKQTTPCLLRITAARRLQLDYLQRNPDAIDALIASGACLSDFNNHWSQKLFVISQLHCHLSILLCSITRSMPDRIFKLVPRYVRPLVRGKAGTAVEFGAKISASVR